MIVDDDALVRLCLADLLDSADGIEVVAQAVYGLHAVEQATAQRVDVALVDVRMPRMDGITAITHLRALPHPPKVITLTTFDLDEYVYNALSAGADGFLLKDTDPAEILEPFADVVVGQSLSHETRGRHAGAPADRRSARPRAHVHRRRGSRAPPCG